MYGKHVEDKPVGLGIVQRFNTEIQKAWRDARMIAPLEDDLVCVVSEHETYVTLKFGPRADYIEKLEQQGFPLKSLRLPAGDVEPKFPRCLALWVVVPTPQGVGVLRLMDTPVITSKGGDA